MDPQRSHFSGQLGGERDGKTGSGGRGGGGGQNKRLVENNTEDY